MLCSLPPALCIHVCTDTVDLEGVVFLAFSILPAFYILSASYSAGFPEPWAGGDLMETSHLGVRVPRSLILCTLPGCGSLFPSTARGRSLSDGD